MRAVLAIMTLAVTFTPCALAAERPWAGMTAAQAIERAKKDLVRQGVAAGDITPAEGAAMVRSFDQLPARTKRVSRYHHKPMWIVWWAGTPYRFCVGARGLDLYCSVGEIAR
jgi:hypothetical protein